MTATSITLALLWPAMGRSIFDGPGSFYSRQPEWHRNVGEYIGTAPFVVGAIVLLVQLRQKQFARSLFFAIGGCLPVIAIITWFVFIPAAVEYAQRTDFDSELWRGSQSMPGYEPIRIRMVDDLLDEFDLHGMSPSEIVNLLGPSDGGEMWDASYVYWLGPERGLFSIDSEWLLIELDSKSRVSSVRIVRD